MGERGCDIGWESNFIYGAIRKIPKHQKLLFRDIREIA